MSTRCTAPTASGGACRFVAMEGRDLCATHAAQRGDEEASALLRARQAAGHPVRQRKRAAGKRSACSLRSPTDLLVELERALLRVDNATGDVVSRTKAITSIVSEARAVLRTELLAEENEALRAALATHAPELARRLKAVK